MRSPAAASVNQSSEPCLGLHATEEPDDVSPSVCTGRRAAAARLQAHGVAGAFASVTSPPPAPSLQTARTAFGV